MPPGTLLQGHFAIMGGIFHEGTSLDRVQQQDGTSNTLLLAHKGVEPRYYYEQGPNDAGWYSLNIYREHKRYFGYLGQDQNGPVLINGQVVDFSNVLAAPHPRSMPVLLANGAVRQLGYTLEATVLMRLWAFNDGQEVQFAE